MRKQTRFHRPSEIGDEQRSSGLQHAGYLADRSAARIIG
jgi:hypothetical protein